MDFLDLLRGQLTSDAIEGLSRHTGINDAVKTRNASNAILAFLTKALARNTSSAEGATALLSALDRDHDGSALDDVIGLLTGALGSGSGFSSKTLNGIGILEHILGARQNFVIDAIARMVGLHKNQTAMLMIRLAPMVLGMLGRKKKENNLNERGLSDLLLDSITNRESNPDKSILSQILDRDKDGSAMDEITKMGMNVLGKFLFK